MNPIAWNCPGCSALVEPFLHHCHRCGAARDQMQSLDVPVEKGTPAEFITAVVRASIEPRPYHGPIPDTVPAKTEFVAQPAGTRPSGTLAERPLIVPPSRGLSQNPPSNVQPSTSNNWIWVLFILGLALIATFAALYLLAWPFREFVDGIVDNVIG